MDINIELFQNYYNIKFVNQMMLIIDFMPFIGPIKNASESLLANLSNDNKLARDKGITALVTSTIDLIGLCLGVASVAYLYEKFKQIDTTSIFKDLLIIAILITLIAFAIGAKIVVDQLVRLLIDNLVGVNTASASMVKSVTITAEGIEAFVGSVNNTTYNIVSGVSNSLNICYHSIMSVIYAPIRVTRTTSKYINSSQKYAEQVIVKKSKDRLLSLFYNWISLIQAIITIILVFIAFSFRVIANTKLYLFSTQIFSTLTKCLRFKQN